MTSDKEMNDIHGLDNSESDGNTSFLRAARNGQLEKVLEYLKTNIDINTSNANGLNALHLASKDGHVEIVEELLKRGAIVDAATKKGNTALHIASLAGQEEVVKLLVQHGASVNVQSQNGFTPLYMAAQENHDNVVKFLLANGANQSLSTEDGFTPLAVAMQQGHDKVVTVLLENDTRGKVRLPALHIAAKKDDVRAAKLLLENDHNPDVTSKSGFTPLHIASHYGNQPIANLLVQKGADVNYSAKHNITPLHVAAKWGKSNMVSLLLEQGAHIEAKTRDGLTPLHCAARSGHEQVVDMLLEKSAPISSKTKNGLAPLHMAAQGDHVDAARILLYHRAPVDEVTVDYLTALHVAAHCGHVRVAKLLLDRQADANARALNGFTPLHIACKKNRIKVVELLLKHGACIGATTESGLTPLHVASFMGCMNIVIYLLQHDASPDIPTVRGETPLHLAARANQTDIIRILLRNGAQVDARAREQQTPLHVASRLGNVDIVMLLLQHGAKIDNTTKDLYTSLHIAAKEGQDEVAAVLIENGASLNSTTKKGFTPLHLAAKYGHLKVAKLLVQKEAPVDAQGKNGVTPLHVASHYDHQNVALLLLEKGASPHAEAKNGHTPLHIAARKNQMDVAHTLLEYGAKPDVESKAGFTPLHLSSQEGHAEISSLLLEHRATPDYPSKNGLTPLHLCAQENRVAVADLLHKNGADIDKQTKAGYTPLHIASHYGQADMVKFLLSKGANVKATTSLGYTPLHQAAQQGHTNIVNILLENSAQPNAVTNNGQTPLNIAQKLGYITVIDTLKEVTETAQSPVPSDEKYRHVAPELMHETFLSDSEEEGEDTLLGDQTYRYLTADEMKSLGDDSLPIDVTRDERIDSNRMVGSDDPNAYPPRHIEDSISPEHIHPNYVEYIKKATDNVDISRHPVNIGFLVSFLVDARGGAMRGCRHSGVRVIVPPRCAPSPTRITCRYVRPQRTPHPPPLMEGEALASRVLELGPVGAKFLGPVIIEVPHFAALRGKEREIVILRSDNGESWKEHTVEATEDVLNEVLRESFDTEDLNQLEDHCSGRTTRIITQDFPQYFAVISRIRQEVHAIGPEGGMVSSTVVPQVQAVFPQGALTKKIKVGLQAQPIDPELTAKLLGHGVAVSPVVTVEPRRRKFHKAITLSMPAPRAHSQGMINQYSGSAPTLRLLCSITGGTSRAQWEDVTGSTPLTFVNDCVSFTTTVSARFWLMDCRNVGDATKMATELYREAIHVPFIAKFVVFAKRIDPLEARLRVFCMTDDKEEKTLEYQEQFTEIAKSRDVEVLEGKSQFIEFAGNLVPITKSGEQLQFSFRAFKENRLPFSVRVKDQHAEAVSRCLFMREPKVQKGEAPQQPICILNIVLPDDIVSETISLTDSESIRKKYYANENFDYYRQDPRLADMSNLLGDDWVDVATHLGLTSSEINVIKSEYPDSVAKQAQSMLRMWLSQSGSKVQTNTLENALRRIGREDIVNQCLNIDNRNQEILRIRTEEKEKHRLISDNRIEDKSSHEKYTKEERVIRSFTSNLDKYSAEEKTFEPSDEEEEEDFNKTVPERREQIVKRLSTERTIPASSQRVEIVQEISSIKRQSLVEDKIAEVQQKANIEPMKINMNKPVSKIIQEKKDQKVTAYDEEMSEKTEKSQINAQNEEKRDDQNLSNLDDQEKPDRRDSVLLEEVTQLLETKRPVAKLTNQEDPNSPEFSKTPPPSPADFLKEKQATTIQEWNATEDTEKLSRPQPDSVREETTGKTSSTQFFIKLDDKSKNTQGSPVVTFPNFTNEDHSETRQKRTTTESTKVTESNVPKHVLAGIDFSEETIVIEKQDDEASKESQEHKANLVGESKLKTVETSDINNDSAAEMIQDKFVPKEEKFQNIFTKPLKSENQLDERYEAERKEENEKSDVKQPNQHEARELEENEAQMEKKKQNKTITNEDMKKENMTKEIQTAKTHKEGGNHQEMKVATNDFILMEIDRYDYVEVDDTKRNESGTREKQKAKQSPTNLKSPTSTFVTTETKEFHEAEKKIETKETVEKQEKTQLSELLTENKHTLIKTHAFLTTEQEHYQDADLKNVKQELESTETQPIEVKKEVDVDLGLGPENQKQTTISDSTSSKEKHGFFSFFKSKGANKSESKEIAVERNGKNDSITQEENKEQEMENSKEEESKRMKNKELIEISNDFLKNEVKNYENIKNAKSEVYSKQGKQNLNVDFSQAKPKMVSEELESQCTYETKNKPEPKQREMFDRSHSDGIHEQRNNEKLTEDIKKHPEAHGDQLITKFSEKIPEKDMSSTVATKEDKVRYNERDETLKVANSTFLSIEKEKFEDFRVDHSLTKQTERTISTGPGIGKLNEAMNEKQVSQQAEIMKLSSDEIDRTTKEFLSAEIKQYDGPNYSKFNREIQPPETNTVPECVEEEQDEEKTTLSRTIVQETTDLDDIHKEKKSQKTCEEPEESKEKKNTSSIFKFFKGKSGKDKKNKTKTKEIITQSYGNENVEPLKASSIVIIDIEERSGDSDHAMKTSTILPIQKEIKNRFSITTVGKANVPVNEGNISQEHSTIRSNEIHEITKDFLGKEVEHYHDEKYSRLETELKPNGIKTDRDYEIEITAELKHINSFDTTHPNEIHPEKPSKDTEGYSKQLDNKSITTLPKETPKEDKSTNNDVVVNIEGKNQEKLRAANSTFLSTKKEAYEDAKDIRKKIDDSLTKQTQNVIDISPEIENAKEEIMNVFPDKTNKMTKDFLCAEIEQYDGEKYSHRELQPSEIHSQPKYAKGERETEIKIDPETADEIHGEITGESEDPKEKPKKSSIFKFFKGKPKKETKNKAKYKDDMSQSYENVEPLKASATVPIEDNKRSEYGKHTVETGELLPFQKEMKETFSTQTNVPINEGDTSQEQVHTNMLPNLINEHTKDFLDKEKQLYHDENYSRSKTETKANDINVHEDEKYEFSENVVELRDDSRKQEKDEKRFTSTLNHKQSNDPIHRTEMSNEQPKPSMPLSMIHEMTNNFLSNEIQLYNDAKASNLGLRSELETVTSSEQAILKKESHKLTNGSDNIEEEKGMLRDRIESKTSKILQGNINEPKTLEEPKIIITLNEVKESTASFLLEETKNYDRSVNYPEWRTIEEKDPGTNYDQHFKENTVSLKSGQSVPQKTIEEKPLTEKHIIETANEKIQKELTVKEDEKIEETTKVTTKRKKSGIFNYLKGKFKKSRSVEADTSKEEYEEIHEMINATSSFLTEEQTRYEDGKPSITKTPLEAIESKTQKSLIDQSVAHIPIEDEINIETPSFKKETKTCTDTSATESKETWNAESDVKEMDKEIINSKQNGNVKKVSFDESININRELAMITQSFLEKEKNYDCDEETTLAKLSSMKISDNKEYSSKTENIERKDLLVLDKQSNESGIESEVILEPHKAAFIKDIEKKEMKSLLTNEDKIMKEDQEKINEQSKSHKKKGILGFLKKKSKDTEDAASPLSTLSDNETHKTSGMETTKVELIEPTTTLELDKNKQQVGIELEFQEKSHPAEESTTKKKQKKTQLDNESTEPKGILGFLFKKMKPKNKEETSTYQAAEDFSKILEETKTFLDKETEMYQDTRRSPSKNTNMEQKTQEKHLKLPEKEVIREEMTQVATSNLNNIESHDIEKKEEELIDEIPEYTAFDFIKEEIETFEKTRLPCTSKVDSSIRIETEIETVEGDSPKEIITKKIFVTERLVEGKDDMASNTTSQEILKKLMDANEDLKAQLNAQENENQTIFRIKKQNSQLDGEENRTEGKIVEDHMKQNSHDIIGGEFVENIEDVELARSNVVEDVSIFEEKIDIRKNRNQEVVTDLDDITSDEHSSINSQNTEEMEKVTRGKSQDYSSEYFPINEENISSRGEILTSQASPNQRIEKSRNKRGSITKFTDQGGTLSDIVNVTEDLVADLKIEYSPYPKRREGFKNVEMDDEVNICEDDEITLSNRKRKPIFRIESEEETPSNPENTSANEEIDSLIRGLVSDDAGEPVESITKNLVEKEAVSDGHVDIETIEKKLYDLGKALETLEKLEDSEPSDKNEVRERKLRRIERKFEHMASETNESPPENKQSIELSNSPKTEQYQELVSQLSQDEVMSFQGDYNNLWDEYTFSKTDEWNSKTPDSQADVLELPQGDIVYMAPVNLNKDHNVNKAGVEVDVIPIMPSPHMSPDLKKNRKRRRNISSSPEHHPAAYLQGSITRKILQLTPTRFLSRTSVNEDDSPNSDEKLWITRSLDDVSISPRRPINSSRGPIMTAVVGWLNTPTEESEFVRFDSEKTSKKSRKLLNRNTKDTNCRDATLDKQSIPLIINFIGETSHTSTSEPSDTTTTKDHQASTSERDEEEVRQHQMDQHQLSSEMRDLLREMEEASKK